jgi:hypothetical protein
MISDEDDTLQTIHRARQTVEKDLLEEESDVLEALMDVSWMS